MTTIRRAGPDDLEVIVALNRHVQDVHFGARPDWFTEPDPEAARDDLRSRLGDDSVHVLLALEGERADAKPVGYALTFVGRRPPSPFMRDEVALFLDQIAVAPDRRRQGHGAALLDAVRSLASDLGVDRVALTVWAFNTAARSFFVRAGFAPDWERLSLELR